MFTTSHLLGIFFIITVFTILITVGIGVIIYCILLRHIDSGE